VLTMAAGHLERWRAGTVKVAGDVSVMPTESWPGHHVVAGPNSLRTEERKSDTSDQLGVLEQFVLVEDSLERR